MPLAAAALLLAAPARADESGGTELAAVGTVAMGAGVVGGEPASALDLGVDVAGEHHAIGIGGRVHYLPGAGLRSEDWDEVSEILGIIRYAVLDRRRGQGLSIAAAAGELGDVRHGHATVLAGYASGLALDHGRFGAQVRSAQDGVAAEAMIDDLASPRILGARAAAALSPRLELGVSFSADIRAPAAGGEAAVGIAAVDAALRGDARQRRYRGRLTLDGASAAGLGAGLHVGAGGSAAIAGGRAELGARAELRLSSGGYIPAYFHPLYERDRVVADEGHSQLDLARRGGLGGASALGELELRWPGAGAGAIAYASRPVLADQLVLRAEIPHFRYVQGALWAAVAAGSGPGRGAALAAEVRARLPDPLVVSLDVSRLYRSLPEASPEPAWTAIASVGAVFGE